MGPNNEMHHTWGNGNGSGSEKFDYFDHLAFESPTDADFDTNARNPWLTNSNGKDGAPAGGKIFGSKGYAFPQK